MENRTLESPQHITRIFIAVCSFIVISLIIVVIGALIFAPWVLGIALWYAVIYVIPILLVVWGITLFVRYWRLLKQELVQSEKRIWIESVLMNGVSFYIFMWLVPFFHLPLVIIPLIACWNIVAIVLSIIRVNRLSYKTS